MEYKAVASIAELTLVLGFSASHLDDQYMDVIRCIMRFYNGDEGIGESLVGSSYDLRGEIAAESQLEIQNTPNLIDCVAVFQYFYYMAPSPKEFCVEMKRTYNASYGHAKKSYHYLLNVHKSPEGFSVPQLSFSITDDNEDDEGR
eukprot:282871_1